ncbi:terpene synthase family protein [Streptacidiphilus melanogenes]|uniref:terpene synthase family protein n=1 Tax=Streptacidiphilus melanogenes TaxID=411235 RepID=UPI0005A812D5|nr:terpene synthase family protein [Streptacidiphilus melanogenes]
MTRVVGVADSALLGARVIQLLRRLNGWSASLDCEFTPQVAEMAALALTCAAPESHPRELLPAAVNVVWAQTVDDRFDVDAKSADDVERLIARCRAVARGAAPDPGDAVEAALASLVGRLSATALAPALMPVWLRRLDLMMDACRFEWLLGRAGVEAERPTLEEYLAHHHSVGFGTICVAWWMSTGGPELPGRLDALLAAADEMECAVRLANDRRTAPRESAVEGCAANATALGADAVWLDERIHAYLDAGHALLRPLEATLPQARQLGRVADWLVGLYGVTEARLGGRVPGQGG